MKKFLAIFVLILIGVYTLYTINPSLFRLGETSKSGTSSHSVDAPKYSLEPTNISLTTKPLSLIKQDGSVYDPIIYTLGNGLQVVLIANKRAPVVKQTVYYKVGGIDDPVGKSGIAHFLEHLMFLGKSKYSPPKQFKNIVKKFGGSFNAYTTFDHTAYFITAPKDKLEDIIKLESGRMIELHLDESLVGPERDVIIEERNSRFDTQPKGLLFEASFRALFQNHNFGRPLIGWRHEMEGLTLQDAQRFHNHWYCPNNAVLVIVGDFDVKAAKTLVEQHYGSIPKREIFKRNLLKEPVNRGITRRVESSNERVKQITIDYYYITDSLSYGDANVVFTLNIAESILSNGQDSKLHKHFVIRNKLASEASMSYSGSMAGPGFLTLTIVPLPGVSQEKIESALNDYIETLAKEGVSETDVKDAKSQILNTFEYARDSAFSGESPIGTTLVRGRSIDEIEKLPAYIKAVTAEQVNKHLKEIISKPPQVISVIKPKISIDRKSNIKVSS